MFLGKADFGSGAKLLPEAADIIVARDVRDNIQEGRTLNGSHGGSVTVTSSQVSGTSFTVRLPREFVMHAGQPILDEEHLRTM